MEPCRVIIVDDEECIRHSLALYFAAMGCDVRALDRPAALDLEDFDPRRDVVLSDFHMPGQNGLDFLEALQREFPELTPDRIGLMSAALSDEDKERAKSRRYRIFNKPTHPETLHQWARSAARRATKSEGESRDVA